jgi:hypothetical protein
MSQSLAVRRAAAQPGTHERPAVLDPRRKLQLALAAIWLLDAMLQFQPVMFGKSFPQMLAGSAQGNPAALARPITWSAAFIGHHVVVLNAFFAATQLLLGLGIAFRPTVRLALAASVAWALAVWWLGEGLGGVLAGTASPLNGAPGAVVLYALLAVLLWPVDRDPAAPFPAARAVGRRVAQASWLVVWLSLASLALLPASRAPQAISGAMPGEPAWLVRIDAHAASALARHGLLVSIALAVVLVLVAVGVCLPVRAARATIVLAVAVAAVLWLAEGLGAILTGSGTDPNTGPLLALLALAFWPATPRSAALPAAQLPAPPPTAQLPAPVTAAKPSAAEPATPSPATSPGAA